MKQHDDPSCAGMQSQWMNGNGTWGHLSCGPAWCCCQPMRWQRRSWLCAATGSRKDLLQLAPPPFPLCQPLEAGMGHSSPSLWEVRMGCVAVVWANDSVHEPWWFGSLSSASCNLLCPSSASDFYMGSLTLICDFPFSKHNLEFRLVFWPSRQL